MKAIRGSRGVCKPEQQQQQQPPRPRISSSNIGGRRTQQHVLRHQARRLRHQPVTDQSDVLPTNELPRGFGRTGRTTETADRGPDTRYELPDTIRVSVRYEDALMLLLLLPPRPNFLLSPSVYSKRHKFKLNRASAVRVRGPASLEPPWPGPSHFHSQEETRNIRHPFISQSYCK